MPKRTEITNFQSKIKISKNCFLCWNKNKIRSSQSEINLRFQLRHIFQSQTNKKHNMWSKSSISHIFFVFFHILCFLFASLKFFQKQLIQILILQHGFSSLFFIMKWLNWTIFNKLGYISDFGDLFVVFDLQIFEASNFGKSALVDQGSFWEKRYKMMIGPQTNTIKRRSHASQCVNGNRVSNNRGFGSKEFVHRVSGTLTEIYGG